MMLSACSISRTTAVVFVVVAALGGFGDMSTTTRLVDGFCVSRGPSGGDFRVVVSAAKGFGGAPPPPTPKKARSGSALPPDATQVAAPAVAEEADRSAPSSSASPDGGDIPQPVSTVQGRASLDRMRRQAAERRNDELQKYRDVQAADRLVRETPEAAVIPERVAQRMGKRMLPFVGVPLFGGMASFVGFWYMATYKDVEFQPALVAATTIALLAVGLVGITYSIMSASWDPDREGSFLGTDEFSQNLGNIKSGLSRSRDNAILREQMATPSFPQDELDALDRKTATKKASSFQEKMGEEMDN